MKNNKTKILISIFIAALFLRLLAVFGQAESDKLPQRDAVGYDEIAVNLISGNGFCLFENGSMVPVAYRPPAYPLFLAGIYSIFGHSYIAVKIIQAIIGALFCIIIFFIANIIYNDIMPGLIASLCAALYKPFIWGFSYYGGPAILLSEYLYMFMIGLAILTILYFIKNGDMKVGMLSGIFMGLAILTRAEFMVFAGLLAIYLLYISNLSMKVFLKKYTIVYLFLILTISPWTIRNYIVFKEFIPVNTLGGGIFWLGNNSSANGGSADIRLAASLVNSEPMKNLSENQKSKVLFEMGIKELKNNPKRIPGIFIRKILVHWAPFENGFKMFNTFYAFALFLGGIGILFFRKKIILEKILLIALLSTTLTAVVTFGEPRYRYAYEPYLIVFAALVFSKIIRKGEKWKKT